MWTPEAIPDEDRIYRRVHRREVKSSDGQPTTAAFKARRSKSDPIAAPAVSTDWNRYSTPAETRARDVPNAVDWGVVSLSVASIRAIPLPVEHRPENTNRAHAEIGCRVFANGGNSNGAEERVKLSRCDVKWEIPPG